jgi:hypothetical protein
LAQETGEIWSNSWILVRLGYVSLRRGHPEEARALFDKSQKLFVAEDLPIGVAFTLEGLASLSVVDGQPERAAEVFAWADVVRETRLLSTFATAGLKMLLVRGFGWLVVH